MIHYPPPPLQKPSIAADIRLADQIWPESKCTGKINVVWDESNPNAYAFVYADSHGPNWDGCTIHLVGSNTRTLFPDRLCNVIIHEAGHLAGMAHSKNVKSVMYAYSVYVDYPPCWKLYYRKDPAGRRFNA